MVVRSRQDSHAWEYLERLEHAFARDVHAGVDLVPVSPLDVVVDVCEPRFGETGLLVEVRAVEKAGSDFVHFQEVLRTERCEDPAFICR